MNTISLRVLDFLKKYPPFDLLSESDAQKVSESVNILYLQKGEYLFRQDDAHHNYFYILREGTIILKKNETSEDDLLSTEQTIDLCDEGELFGLRALIAKDQYLMSAIAEEGSIVFGIPIKILEPILLSNPRVGFYMVEAFASKTKNPYYSQYLTTAYKEHRSSLEKSIDELQTVKYTKKLVCITPQTSIKDAANLMTNKNVGSVIVIDKQSHPVGIVTDKNLRTGIASSDFSVTETVATIMSSPVKTFTKDMSAAQAQLNMVKHSISHLCITQDGTTESPIIGILSAQDLLVMQGHTAYGLLKAIKRANKRKQLKAIRLKMQRLLKNYMSNNIPITFIIKTFHQLNESLTQRAIELAINSMDTKPPTKFAWLSLGSHGRSEQFLLTDQDNAIVFDDVLPDKYQDTKSYFLKLAAHVNKTLKTVGYEYCPADMMARNPKWCLSLSQWKQNFQKWIIDVDNQDILFCSIFFDYNCSYGDIALVNNMTEYIFNTIKDDTPFLPRLAKSALEKPPPLGFFRQFLVEQDGEHKNAFDLKYRAVMPLVDIARLLSLNYRIRGINGTDERFKKLAELEPQNQELYMSCSYAIKSLIRFRTKHGLIHQNSGRYIKLDELTKEERLKLKRCFKVISRLQETVKIRFRVSDYV